MMRTGIQARSASKGSSATEPDDVTRLRVGLVYPELTDILNQPWFRAASGGRPRLQRSRHLLSGIESAAAKEPAFKQEELF